MIKFILALALLGLCHAEKQSDLDTNAFLEELVSRSQNEDATEELTWREKMLKQLNSTARLMARQFIMQQLYYDERTRSDGDSGIKQVRVNSGGTRPFFAPTHTGPNGAASVHDHSNHIRTMGMGEFAAVLNGVEFRTRHNDYSLKQPSTSSTGFGALEDIEFPDVPPAVLQKTKVEDQIVEMRKWFKAFEEQDSKTRDYTKYFKPVMCYLEGWWENTTNDEPIDEMNKSSHSFDAETWEEMLKKTRFNSYTGNKDVDENLAFLPKTVISVDGITPIYAQWNYRIACHPLSEDVELDRLRSIDDISYRMATKRPPTRFTNSRSARFELNVMTQERNRNWGQKAARLTYLDSLMSEIPGMDNHGADLTDNAWGLTAIKFQGMQNRNDTTLNTGYYHKWYKVDRRDAMGVQVRKRSFSDATIYMAMNSQDKVAGVSVDDCKKQNGEKVCNTYSQKWSYAIPLELVYLTPLHKWNPYNIEHKGEPQSSLGGSVTAGGRTGDAGNDKAYNGTHDKLYYRVPAAFFYGDEVGKDPADTVNGAVHVLDKTGTVRQVMASGMRIMLPYIPEVGPVRTRYPIMPIHSDGNTVYKELEAIKDIVLQPVAYRFMRREGGGEGSSQVHLKLTEATVDEHEHYVTLEEEEAEWLYAGAAHGRRTLWNKWSSDANSHNHNLAIRWRHPTEEKPEGQFYIFKCDNKNKCWDGHDKDLVPDQFY